MSQENSHMGFKTAGLLYGLLMIAMWTLAFFVGQVLPALMPGAAPVVVNWAFYFAGLLILIVMIFVVLILHVLWKLVYVGENKFIK